MGKYHEQGHNSSYEEECGCGGICIWIHASDEEKIQMLERKEEKLKKMLEHVKKTKEALSKDNSVDEEDDGDDD